MEIVAKLADAAAMFWQALDERERMLLLAAAGWLCLSAVAVSQQRGEELRQERRLREIVREEMVS